MLVDLVGQPRPAQILSRAVSGQLTSPLLLVGDEGVGKRTSVMFAVRQMFCTGTGLNTCRCNGCTCLQHGVHGDLAFITAPDSKEIGVEEVREACAQLQNYPSTASARVVVIDGADRLTPAAANALLKTLEEPPSTARFFLLAQSYDRVLPTVRSRCGKLRYLALSEAFIADKLSRMGAEPADAALYARMGEGSMGRALRFWSAGRQKMRDAVLSWVERCASGDLPAVFSLIDEAGADLRVALRILGQVLCDMARPRPVIHADVAEQLLRVGASLGRDRLARLWASYNTVLERDERTHINLAFHVKAAFAAVCLASL